MEENKDVEMAMMDSDSDLSYDSDYSDVSSVPELTGIARVKQVVNNVVDSRVVTIIMAVATIYALFGDDFRLAVLPKSADDALTVLTTIALFLFLFELIANGFAKTTLVTTVTPDSGVVERYCRVTGYMFSFFFWLDVVATLSLIPDIPFIWAPIINEDEDGTGETDLTAAKAGRVSRAGSRAGRIIRMVRLVRLVKLYMLTQKKRGPELVKQSQVGSRLSNLTTRRVIVVVLAMLIVVPIFGYTESDLTEELAADLAQRFNLWRQPEWDASVTHLQSELGYWDPDDTESTPRLVKLVLSPEPTRYNNGSGSVNPGDLSFSYSTVEDGFAVVNDAATYNDLRTGLAGAELKKVSYSCTREMSVEDDFTCLTDAQVQAASTPVAFTLVAWFDQKPITVETALYGMGLTVFVTFLLALGAAQFTSDAQRLVLRPIEHMVAFVEKMAKDPITPISSRDNTGQFETNLLENTIKKIGGLLRVGFGQAGASIIAKNLASGSDFNPMVEGRYMHAIFGFITIMQFDESTEILQQNVLLFINKISKVVHDVCMSWGGAPNKNMGEAYLLTWVLEPAVTDTMGKMKRIGSTSRRRSSRALTSAGSFAGGSPMKQRRPSFSRRSKSRGALTDISKLPRATELADRAMIAVLKMMGELSRSADVVDSPEHQQIGQVIPGYYLRMRYGLHVGWAIEGAIGSIHKVDASYLSPHVNIAARMQAAASQYGVPFLMSGPFYQLLSPGAKAYCRKLDVIAVKGSKVPMPVYTYDIWEWKTKEPSRLMNFETFVQFCTDADIFNKYQTNMPAHQRRISLFGSAPIIEHDLTLAEYRSDLFDTDEELKAFRAPFRDEWRREFSIGVDMYIQGNWPKARQLLEHAQRDPNLPRKGGDGPSRTLLSYMARFNYQAPDDWDGYRKLTSK